MEDKISKGRIDNNLGMKAFAEIVRDLVGYDLSKDQLSALQVFEDELLKWNQNISLTAIRDSEGVRTKHFLDSLTVLLAWDRQSSPERVVDVGTGAGFPGLVLKLVWPSIQLTLVESVHKKADFCRHMVERLGLEGVRVLAERAETVGQDPTHRHGYDLAVARAVARMPILMEYLLPLIHRNGVVIAMKGETAHAETHAAHHAINLLGGKLHRIINVKLPGVVEERFIVVIHKVARTPEEYPRRVGAPAKNPIE
jgi:16S rRNA (guanine527-N7)-methyltransferase